MGDQASTVILATKPQKVPDALRSLSVQIGPNTVVMSVAAGVSVQSIKKAVTIPVPVVRIMPNIGALVGHSVSAAYASDDTSIAQRNLVEILFSAVGRFVWFNSEDQLHAVTAVFGSGPAYFFAICEAMITAARSEGLDKATATSLVLGTISTSAHLLEQTPDAAYLRVTATSPNGTMAAGLSVFEKEDSLNRLVAQAIYVARKRSQDMS